MPVLSRCTALVAAGLVIAGVTACGSSTAGTGAANAAQQLTSTTAVTTMVATTSTPRRPAASVKTPAPAKTRTSAPRRTSAARTSNVVAHLPLSYPTGSATQVITATASSMNNTSGTLQAWQKVTGGWTKVGPAVTAWFGEQGLTNHMSEQISATPVGSFTLTQAFGHNANPGTGLPYFRTDSADWWISRTTGADQSVYNTHQRCTQASCPFTPSVPNEQLATSLPYYNYAVVIDYNTRNAPGGVRVGAGSAVFLHVTVNAPTAGCVAIDQSRLVAIMQWLRPSAQPRILIGIA